MIQGYYYLHTNKELIYKNDPDAITDIRESDFCHTAWGWDGQRPTAWQILVESLALGANKERVEELSVKWNCTNEDAESYADYLGIKIYMDGNAFCATRSDFINLQESPCGFGDNYLEAISELAKELGYCGGKMWNATINDLVK